MKSAYPPIIQYWHSAEPPDYILELTGTFRGLNPALRHLVFCEAEAEKLIGEHFTAREVSAFRSCAVPAMQADYFRYCAVLALGGLYADADCRCVADVRPFIPDAGGGLLFRGDKGHVINGVFSFGSPGHAFLELALEIATLNIEHRLHRSVFATTGPMIFLGLTHLHQQGSLRTLSRQAADPRDGQAARVYQGVIESYARLDRAFDGVEIAAAGTHRAIVHPAGRELPYKQTSAHWQMVEGSIFRTPAP
jgi:mannosyltransferase OCH1-like enzyme